MLITGKRRRNVDEDAGSRAHNVLRTVNLVSEDDRSQSSFAAETTQRSNIMQPLEDKLDVSSSEECHSTRHDQDETSEEETSSSGFSDEDESDEAQDETAPSRFQGIKATSKPSSPNYPPSDLQARLSSFLPQLKEANAKLQQDDPSKQLDKVSDDEEHYIEMDLGLGVLKEVQQPEDGIKTARSDSSSDPGCSDSDAGDVIQKALRSKRTNANIEEVDTG